MKRLLHNFLASLSILALVTFLTGCRTEDELNVGGRPWNTPKSWEGGLPSSMTEGR